MNPVSIVPWKVPISNSGSGPYYIKVKLSDLLFNKTDELDITTWTRRLEGDSGYRLPHDILLFDPSVYDDDGHIDYTDEPEITQDKRERNSFFLSKVYYDGRGNHQFQSDPVYRPLELDEDSTAGYIIPDSAANLPLEEDSFRSGMHTFKALTVAPFSEEEIRSDFYTKSLSVGLEGTDLEKTCTLILAKVDSTLESTLPGSSLIPYTRLRLNSDLDQSEVKELVKFFTGYGVLDYNNSPKYIDGVPVPESEMLDPAKNPALRYTEVYLRCSWFADYIDPASYEQQLTPVSDVKHKNLIIGSGDFERFNNETPYLPLTIPREDILTDEIRTADELAHLPIIPISGTSELPDPKTNAPIGWSTPDITDDNDHLSSVIREDGNAYISGRIFSPTIDELWVYVKKLVSGRDIDTLGLTGPSSIGTQKITFDARLNSEPCLTIAKVDDVVTSIGDSLDRDGNTYVNGGEGVRYALSSNLKTLTSKIDSNSLVNYLPFDGENRVGETDLLTSATWGVRSKPFSLRELEGKVLNTQYSLESAFNWLLDYSVLTGDTEKAKDGTLYKLHIDHTPDYNNPVDNSRWLGFDSTEMPEEPDEDYGKSLPLAGQLFDKYKDLSKEDIYLSAEGKWRYLFDHVRIPIMDEEY